MNFIKQNWFKLSIVTAILVIGLFMISRKSPENNLNLQAKCAEEAAKYFASQYGEEGYKDGRTLDYKNHYNSKLNKCLILISDSYGDYDYRHPEDSGRISVDLYDALEDKHYAAFVGNKACYPNAWQSEMCQENHGAIWFDGNDKKSPTFGLDQSDIKNTQEKFLEHIQSFMSD